MDQPLSFSVPPHQYPQHETPEDQGQAPLGKIHMSYVWLHVYIYLLATCTVLRSAAHTVPFPLHRFQNQFSVYAKCTIQDMFKLNQFSRELSRLHGKLNLLAIFKPSLSLKCSCYSELLVTSHSYKLCTLLCIEGTLLCIEEAGIRCIHWFLASWKVSSTPDLRPLSTLPCGTWTSSCLTPETWKTRISYPSNYWPTCWPCWWPWPMLMALANADRCSGSSSLRSDILLLPE